MMKARDIMSRDAECVSASETLETAARRMASAGVGAMPICGDDDRLKGMLTDRDIVVKAIAQGKDVARTLVSELAEGKPVTIGADDSLGEVTRDDGARAGAAAARDRRAPPGRHHQRRGHRPPPARGQERRSAASELSKPGRSAAPSRMRGRADRRARGGRRLRAAPRGGPRSRATIQQSTVVNVPVRSAYDQWTQFEEFPSFMSGVEQVQQLDDTRPALARQGRRQGARLGRDDHRAGARREDRVAGDERQAQRRHVRFEALDEDRTRVEVEMAFEPEGIAELVGSAIGLPERRVKGDLERFRELIEKRRGQPTGAWRGKVGTSA